MRTSIHMLQVVLEPELRPSPNLFEGWMLGVFFIVLAIVAYVRIAYPRRVQRLLNSVVRIQIMRQLMREELVFSHRASVLLFGNFVMVFALLLYLAFKFYGWTMPFGGGLAAYGTIAFALGFLYLGKLALKRFLRWLFQDSGLIREYLFEVFMIKMVMGLVLLPLVLGLAFLNVGSLHHLFLASAMLVMLMLIFRIFQGLGISAGHPVSRVYIILYLCSLEILPFLVIIKALGSAVV